ncbi:MAG: AraC family transcriptional regulator [Paenibacillus sp.]|jgi:AraC-like DNA-binding protein/quercetin dioxygenase-like cupin family protein|nr:AraC family transcriptional regulator [Paenibacillus sp.]
MHGLKEYATEYAKMAFYKPSDLEKALGVFPMFAGRMVAKPHYQTIPRSYHYFVIQFILDGQMLFKVGEQTIFLDKGDMFCLFPDVTAQYGVVPEKPKLQLAWFGLDGEGVRLMLQSVGITEERPFIRKIGITGLPSMLHQLLDEFLLLKSGGSNYYRWISKLYEMFDHLAGSAPAQPLPLREKNAYEWIKESESFMASHFARDISVQDVADYVGIHRSHFTVAFTKQLGISPRQYLIRLRMTHGAKMLEETDTSITDIALYLGYSDIFAFTRAFSNYYSMPPSQYRASKRA